MSAILQIDGAMGEGGGQVLRTALSLSAITGAAFRIGNIRANRPKPGLAAQHQTCVRAAARICGATVRGDEAGSREVTFRPGRLAAGEYSFSVRTAGAASLVAQTVALPLALAGGPSQVLVRGGTHVPWSPSFGYLGDVWCRVLCSLGLPVAAQLERPGYYPRGCGELRLTVRGTGRLMPLEAQTRAALQGVGARLTFSRLSDDTAARCRFRADELLAGQGLFAEWEISRLPAASPGVCLDLAANFGVLAAGFSALGERGKSAERLAEEAVGALTAFMASEAAVDEHLADQLVMPLALAAGRSVVSVARISRHLTTVVELTGIFLPGGKVSLRGEPGQPGTLLVEPIPDLCRVLGGSRGVHVLHRRGSG
jgi:RNA 3'-terminal phosphate cyclase (ATP)